LRYELLAILLLFLVVLTSVSLLSYSPIDPSINHQSFSSEHVQNLFGVIGAHLSGIFVDILGVDSLAGFRLDLKAICFKKNLPDADFSIDPPTETAKLSTAKKTNEITRPPS
jgi:hypothetical protein